MQIETGLQPNCSEYVVKVRIDEKKERLLDLLSRLQSGELTEEEKNMGVGDTSMLTFEDGVALGIPVVIINGYLNEDGLLEWLGEYGYLFDFNGD